MEGKDGVKKVVPKVVRIDKALNTAKIWVKNMSGGAAMHQQTENETEGRPAGLGLGARINPHAKSAPSTDPVERKLIGKINTKRKQNSENEDHKVNSNDKNEEDSDDETESRTSSFVKKKPVLNSTASFVPKKRK